MSDQCEAVSALVELCKPSVPCVDFDLESCASEVLKTRWSSLLLWNLSDVQLTVEGPSLRGVHEVVVNVVSVDLLVCVCTGTWVWVNRLVWMDEWAGG